MRDPQRVRPWLFTIATNAWRDRQRALNRRPNTVPLDPEAVDEDFSLFATLAIEDPFPYSDELYLDFLRLFCDEDMQTLVGQVSPVYIPASLAATVRLKSRDRAPGTG